MISKGLLKEKIQQAEEDVDVARRHDGTSSFVFHYALGKMDVLEELLKEAEDETEE